MAAAKMFAFFVITCPLVITTMSTTATVTPSATASYYDWCSPNPCYYGSCDRYNRRCSCYTGYTGQYCQYYYGPTSESRTVSTTAMVTPSATASYYDWCSSNPCRSGSCSSYYRRCNCYAGYTGQYCEYYYGPTTESTTVSTTAMVTPSATASYYDWCSSYPCYYGSCDSYNRRCSCYTGYTGQYCQYYYGTSTESTTVSTTAMVTPSATASYYDWCSSNPCRSGSCSSYYRRCNCYAGYTGQYCEYYYGPTTEPTTTADNCLYTGCANGGSCFDGRCYCYYGYTWQYCESLPTPSSIVTPSATASYYDWCSSNPCRSGSCSSYSRRCYCYAGYTGQYCEYYYGPTSEPTTTAADCLYTGCANGGSCLYNGRCYCYNGYTGQYCESLPTSSSIATPSATASYYDWCSSNPCRSGSCSSYYRRCYCYAGYTGQYCDYYYGPTSEPTTTANLCPNARCANGGSCYYGRCYCYNGYTGQYCESLPTSSSIATPSATASYYDWCSSNPCRSGSCSSYYRRCYCYAGYTGQYCDYYYGPTSEPTTTANLCPNARCANGGSCYYGRCYCYNGYTGQYCESYDFYTTTQSPQRLGGQDGIRVSCDDNRFKVTVDHDWLVSKHPTALSSAYMNIYFGTCQVYNRYMYMSTQYSFIHYFISCGTTRTETYNEIVYTNRLYIKDNNAMITREEMGYLIECRMNKDTSVYGSFHSSNVSQIISSSGNFSASMRFSRYEYSSYIYTFPAQMSLNETMYAHIELNSMFYSLKSVIEECVARPDNTSRTDEVYYLIRNRCSVDSTTDILHENQTAEFRFKTFDFIRETGSVYIECKVHICTADDNSYRCTRGCSGYGRKKRSVDVEEPISLSGGPFVYSTETVSDDTDVDNGVTTAMAVGIGAGATVVAAFAITLVVKLKPVLMASAKVAPAGYTSIPQSM